MDAGLCTPDQSKAPDRLHPAFGRRECRVALRLSILERVLIGCPGWFQLIVEHDVDAGLLLDPDHPATLEDLLYLVRINRGCPRTAAGLRIEEPDGGAA